MPEHTNQNGRDSDERKVSKSQLLRFIEAKFQTADRDQDGFLTVTSSGISFDSSRIRTYDPFVRGTDSASDGDRRRLRGAR